MLLPNKWGCSFRWPRRPRRPRRINRLAAAVAGGVRGEGVTAQLQFFNPYGVGSGNPHYCLLPVACCLT